ncbi:sulfatase [Olivibacter sp. SDN3]|uniref:sulfatase family protein n=1 Tax=Olivibacter sp. SDN3 TaxID=2764720 RepID=UPI0016518F07|nr:sulfatase [Olivibacter sp. SDN3]QNL49606.1 sulfatase [Olivibacter sp. SDN3]
MKSVNYCLTILFTVITLFVYATEKQPDTQKKPNIIIFYLDDLGYGDLGVTGALDYETPAIDRMANEGTRFTNFLTGQAVCSASRASLLTGCYPNRIGFSGALSPGSKIGISKEEETIADLLKKAGYHTGIFGKWHLGDHHDFLPLQHGFDEFYGIPYSHDMWPLHPSFKFPPLHVIEGNDIKEEINSLNGIASLTTDITNRAIDFIKRNKEQAFFLYIPHPLPHVPLAVSNKFKGKSKRGLFGDVIMELDWSVGEILKSLHECGLDENTLVLFTSDNGPWLNYGDHAGSSGGFREGKGTSFEGGHRVPLIARWPKQVPAGKISNKLLTTLDILPTVAKLAGAPQPKNKIDGLASVDLLKGQAESSPRTEFLYYYRKNSLEAVRKDNWKLVFAHPGRTYEGFLPGSGGQPGPTTEQYQFQKALYDLNRDPSERYNVLDEHPEIVAELEAIAEKARVDLGDDLQRRSGKNVRQPGVL